MENLQDDALHLQGDDDEQQQQQQQQQQHANISDVTSHFIKTSFAHCDEALSSSSCSQSLFKKNPPYRGEPILKPTLKVVFLQQSSVGGGRKDDDDDEEEESRKNTLLTIPSALFPQQLRWVRFFSAAATLDMDEIQKKCGVLKRSNNNNNNGAGLVVGVRHERLFKHPVSTGAMLQSGCDVRINNKKAETILAASSSARQQKQKQQRRKHPHCWHLYWGGRWRDENLFKLELQNANPTAAENENNVRSVRVNHFPGTHQLARKDNLAIAVRKMRLKYPQDYASVAPQTFVLPRDAALFTAEIASTARINNNKQDDDTASSSSTSTKVFIAKPPASSRGRGVFLFSAPGGDAAVSSLPAAVTRALSLQQQQAPQQSAKKGTNKQQPPRRDTAVSSSSTANNKQKNKKKKNQRSSSSSTRSRTASSSSSTIASSSAVSTSKGSSDDEDDKIDDETEKDCDDDDEDDNDDDDDDDDDGQLLIQRYIHNPLTIHGFKVDLRVYALCTCFDPLKVFVFNDGLVRFATVPYTWSAANSSSLSEKNEQQEQEQMTPLSDLCAHLTNVSVNILSKNSSTFMAATKKNQASNDAEHNSSSQEHNCYNPTDSPEQDGTDEGSKWSLQALKRYITATAGRGAGGAAAANDERVWDECWKGVCRTITKVFLSVQEEVASKVSSIVQKRNTCFEMYGFDILLDEHLKSQVLEVNVLPSLQCGSALDRHIKGHMIADMLSLIGVGVGVGVVSGNDHTDDGDEHNVADQDQQQQQQQKAAKTKDATIPIQTMLDCPIVSAAARKRRQQQQQQSKAAASSLPTTNNNNNSADEEERKLLDSIISSSSNSNNKNNNAQNLAQKKKRFFSTFTDDSDRAVIGYAEEELARRGGWERVFPTPDAVCELKHLFGNNNNNNSSSQQQQQQRTNKILWAWETLKAGGAVTEADAREWLVSSSSSSDQQQNKVAPPPPPPPPPPPRPAATPVIKKAAVVVPRVATVTPATAQQRQPQKNTTTTTSAASLSCQVFSFQQIPPQK